MKRFRDNGGKNDAIIDFPMGQLDVTQFLTDVRRFFSGKIGFYTEKMEKIA